MTASPFNSLRNQENYQDPNDERMNQVRELLLGDHIRASEARLAALERRLRDLETTIEQRIDVIHVRLEALAGEVHGDQRAAFDELAKSISDLGNRIRRISKA